MRDQVYGHVDMPQCRRHHVSASLLVPHQLQLGLLADFSLRSLVHRLNKYILDPKLGGFPFPLTLTGIHMLFCSAVSWGLVRLGMVDAPQMPIDTYVRYAALPEANIALPNSTGALSGWGRV